MADEKMKEAIKSKVDDTLLPIDILSWLILKDWIPIGFPTTDPKQQVQTAYQYAKLMLDVRKEYSG